MKLLKKLTGAETVVILVGPFVDETDGKTAETGLTLTSGDFQVWKGAAASLAAKNDSSAGTHRGLGYYTTTLDATDVGTNGPLTIAVHESGALPVRQDYMVVPDHVYDGLVATTGTDYLQVDVRQINSTSEAAVQLSRNVLLSQTGTVYDDGSTYAASTTVFYSDDITEATADHYNGRVVLFRVGSALAYEATTITDYELVGGLYGKFTVTALTDIPANDATFQII
jgi:hypothetical protein